MKDFSYADAINFITAYSVDVRFVPGIHFQGEWRAEVMTVKGLMGVTEPVQRLGAELVETVVRRLIKNLHEHVAGKLAA